jgi:hypothetical protein
MDCSSSGSPELLEATLSEDIVESQALQTERNAFSRSGLPDAMVPASVKVLGGACFQSCDALASVTFEPVPALAPINELANSNALHCLGLSLKFPLSD